MALLNYCMFDVSWHFVFIADFESLVDHRICQSAICPGNPFGAKRFLQLSETAYFQWWFTGIGGGIGLCRVFSSLAGSFPSKPPLPTRVATSNPQLKCITAGCESCGLQANDTGSIHLLSLIWIFHEYKYSESDGGTQTQQKWVYL